ncbi:hypothetical protein [Glycomyces dulcitolivorans]|uniref:hypothetical protein n=1 Tax=Glycomyces dulcitolivorans TaxID=2200759 RepID=UPI00130040E3|nr:hypothetical protein [Glycomyces dulcitolivorans]
MDVYAAPPFVPPAKPAGSFEVMFLRVVLIVHAALIPFTAVFFLVVLYFFGGIVPERQIFTQVAMTALVVLDCTFKVAAAVTVKSAPPRLAWYLGGSVAIFVGYLSVLITHFQAIIPFAYLPLGIEILLVVELAFYFSIRRRFPELLKSPQPQHRARADLILLGSGVAVACLLGLQQGVHLSNWLPEYTRDDADGLIDDAYAEIAAELEEPPQDFSGSPQSWECDDEFVLTQFWKHYKFETGTFEEIAPEMRDIWTELGYDVNESITEEDGVPYMEATRSDGVEVVLTMGHNDQIEDNVILTVNSGCVNG